MRWLPALFLLGILALAYCLACPAQAGSGPEPKKLRAVVFGAHPDDPESGCGGLIALLTKAGQRPRG
jgi:hypothetical protein